MIKVNNVEVELNRFPDGTLNLNGNPELNYGNVIISWHYHDDTEFMAVAFLTKYYQSHGNKVKLYLPYVPNARMDRVETSGNIFAIKYFGELINSLNFDEVIVMDVHSSVTIASIKNCRFIGNIIERKVFEKIYEIEGELPVVFFPDEGAMKRYSKNLNIPFAFGMKKRNWNNGQILGLEVLGMTSEEIKGKNILIWDDICSYGGTFYHSAKKLKEMGANNIYLMVTHCEPNIHNGNFGINKNNLLDTGLIKMVFTTDSIYDLGTSKNVYVVNTCLDICENGCGCCIYGSYDKENMNE